MEQEQAEKRVFGDDETWLGVIRYEQAREIVDAYVKSVPPSSEDYSLRYPRKEAKSQKECLIVHKTLRYRCPVCPLSLDTFKRRFC